MRIACAQTHPVHKDLKANIGNISDSIAQTNADLIVFPELALSGYFFTSKEDVLPYSLTIDSEEITLLAKVCKVHCRAIVVGFAERNGEDVFNSSILIDRNGVVVGLYRKIHLFYYEKLVFTPGDLGFPVFDLDVSTNEIVKIGMQICYDWRFPEATRSLALRGAEVVAIPSNIVTTTGLLIDTLRVRAFENKVIVAFSDRVGSEQAEISEKIEKLQFRGESCIINYNGEIITGCSTDEATTCYADISPQETVRKDVNLHNNIVKDRRNSMYFL